MYTDEEKVQMLLFLMSPGSCVYLGSLSHRFKFLICGRSSFQESLRRKAQAITLSALLGTRSQYYIVDRLLFG